MTKVLVSTAFALPLAACGHDVEQRAATGAIAGAAVSKAVDRR